MARSRREPTRRAIVDVRASPVGGSVELRRPHRAQAAGVRVGRQFVIRIEDAPGALARLLHGLADRDVNITNTAAIGGGSLALVVLTVSDDDTAREALRADGYAFEEGEPFVVRVPDRPGALAEVADRLAAAGVSVRSMLEVGRHSGQVDDALTVDDVERAMAALEGSGVDRISWRAG